MTTLLLNKPYGVLSQFTPEEGCRWRCLNDFVDVPQVYAAGRLDADSEGLLILTSNGRLQQRLTDPRFGHWRSYWAQVEGTPNAAQLQQLCDGVVVQGRRTLPAKARWLQDQDQPQCRTNTSDSYRAAIPTSWLQLSLTEGRQPAGAPDDGGCWPADVASGALLHRSDGQRSPAGPNGPSTRQLASGDCS